MSGNSNGSGTGSVGKVPGGGLVDIEITEGMTVEDLFFQADQNPDGCRIKKNGVECNLSDHVYPGDTVIAYTDRIKGN